jgi:hypothetical protein
MTASAAVGVNRPRRPCRPPGPGAHLLRTTIGRTPASR